MKSVVSIVLQLLVLKIFIFLILQNIFNRFLIFVWFNVLLIHQYLILIFIFFQGRVLVCKNHFFLFAWWIVDVLLALPLVYFHFSVYQLTIFMFFTYSFIYYYLFYIFFFMNNFYWNLLASNSHKKINFIAIFGDWIRMFLLNKLILILWLLNFHNAFHWIIFSFLNIAISLNTHFMFLSFLNLLNNCLILFLNKVFRVLAIIQNNFS
jgi:hypothetical protein